MPKPSIMKAGSPDEFQTPVEALDCLIPHLRKGSKIWEPSCGKGNLVKGFINNGFHCMGTDILYGDDFMIRTNPDCDYIITNPPFSIKEKFLARCYEIGKPFALLMPLTTFDSKERRQLFNVNGIEVIMPPKRYNFETPTQTENIENKIKSSNKSSAWFYTCWFTWGLNLGRQLIFTDQPQLDLQK